MSIAFDARMLSYSGIGTHIRGILTAIRRLRHPPEMSLLGDLNELTANKLHRGFQVERYVAPVYSAWSQYWFPRHWPGSSALHVPHYNVPYRYADPLVVTIHDLIHLLFPWQLGSALKIAYARYTFRQVADQADRIVCVSEHTRKDVLERLKVEEDRVVTIPNAVRDSFQAPEDESEIDAMRRRCDLPSEYLLAVGIDKPHKNFHFLLRSLKPLWEDRKVEAPLFVAGASAKSAKLSEAIARVDVGEWVTILDWVDGDDMPSLYKGASLLLFPSTYEGFGLPILEAQRVGTPVAAADAASIPEVAGEGAVYFDPYDEESCRHATLSALGDTRLRERVVAAGRENEKRYSWADSAEALVKVYRSL